MLPPQLQGHVNKHSESSPVMPADEIFRLAGWSTPGPFENDNITRSAGASPFLEENWDIMRSKETIPSSFEEIYAISNMNRKRNKDKKKVKDDDDDNESVETARLPNSNNRNSNKDNNRNSYISNAKKSTNNFDIGKYDMSDSLFDENIYFSIYKGQPDNSIDETLSFALSIGWVKNEEEKRMIFESVELDCSITDT